VLADSRSQLQFLRDQRVLGTVDGTVLADGSISGVDLARFRPDAQARAAVRAELGIAGEAIVFVFLGRLQPDKGLADLGAAFARVAAAEPRARLLVIGPDEAGVAARLEAALGARRDRLHLLDFTPAPERFLAAGDVFCLPSYREGFGTSVIEAAACGLPAVASRIYGLTDAVVEGETGLLHRPHDVQGLADAMARLAADPAARARLGAAARARAVAAFSADRVTAALVDWYRAIGLALPEAGG
jgi:glycosyltransferase involved in cell wall biosynthesis